MARARNIKPSIMDNEELAELEPIARLLFIYLWMLADREGRLEDRPKRIAAQALPYDRSVNVDHILSQLHKAGFITRYEAEGVACIQIVAFSKHQNPHVREAASSLPSPEQGTTKAVTRHDQGSAEASPRSPDSGFSDSLIPDSGFGTSCSEPQSDSEPAIAHLPLADKSEFGITHSQILEWSSAYPAVDVEQQIRNMRQWCLANPSRRKTRRGIKAFVVSWLSKEQDKGGRPIPANVQPSFAERDEMARRRKWEEMTGRKWPDRGEAIDIDPVDEFLQIGSNA